MVQPRAQQHRQLVQEVQEAEVVWDTRHYGLPGRLVEQAV
jgi:hypothetical protein